MPDGPSSSAATRMSMSMPAFPTQYALRYRWVSMPAIDDTPTNDPPRPLAITGATCLRVRNVPSTFTSTVAHHESRSDTASGAICCEPPAQATTASRPPVGTTARATASRTCSSSVTSATTHCNSSPAASRRRSSVRPQIVTAAPSAARRRAHAKPMPLPPPVTSAPYPSSALMA